MAEGEKGHHGQFDYERDDERRSGPSGGDDGYRSGQPAGEHRAQDDRGEANAFRGPPGGPQQSETGRHPQAIEESVFAVEEGSTFGERPRAHEHPGACGNPEPATVGDLWHFKYAHDHKIQAVQDDRVAELLEEAVGDRDPAVWELLDRAGTGD